MLVVACGVSTTLCGFAVYDARSFQPRLEQARKLAALTRERGAVLRCRFPHGDTDVRLTYEILLSPELGQYPAIRASRQGNFVVNFYLTLWLVELRVPLPEQASLIEVAETLHPGRIKAVRNDCSPSGSRPS